LAAVVGIGINRALASFENVLVFSEYTGLLLLDARREAGTGSFTRP